MQASEDGGAGSPVVKSETKKGKAAEAEAAAALGGMASGGAGMQCSSLGAQSLAAAAGGAAGGAVGERRGAITAVDAIRIYLAKSDKNPRTSLR